MKTHEQGGRFSPTLMSYLPEPDDVHTTAALVTNRIVPTTDITVRHLSCLEDQAGTVVLREGAM